MPQVPPRRPWRVTSLTGRRVRRIPPVGRTAGAHLRRGGARLSQRPGTHEATRAGQGAREPRPLPRRDGRGDRGAAPLGAPRPRRTGRAACLAGRCSVTRTAAAATAAGETRGRRGGGASAGWAAGRGGLGVARVDSVYQHVLAWREALDQEGIDLSVWWVHRKICMCGGLFTNMLLRETGLAFDSAPLTAADLSAGRDPGSPEPSNCCTRPRRSGRVRRIRVTLHCNPTAAQLDYTTVMLLQVADLTEPALGS